MLRKTVPQPDADIRTDAEITADAIKVLAPRAGEYEKRRKLLTKCIGRMRIIKRVGDAKAPTPAEIKKQLNDRFKRLQAARVDLVAMGSPKELIEAYDSQLRVAKTLISAAVPPGGQPTNMVAACAAVMARDLLLESGQRVRWKQWHRLSALLYEAATGEYGVNLSKYIIMCKSGEIVRSRPTGGYFR
jgi:hypothetical protein